MGRFGFSFGGSNGPRTFGIQEYRWEEEKNTEAEGEEPTGNIRYCGYFQGATGGGGGKVNYPDDEEREQYPLLNGWQWPKRDTESTLKSLRIHSRGLSTGGWEPTKQEQREIANYIVASGEYPETACRACFLGEVGTTIFTKETFGLYKRGIELDVNKDSSPGYPWVKLGTENGNILDDYNDHIWESVADRFNIWINLGESIFTMTPEQLIRNGVFDPVKAFIKNEPHKIQKIVDGKLRIIASVSLLDQLVTRLLCSTQNKAEIATWVSCPSKPGLGLHNEGLLAISTRAKQMLEGGEISMTDISGWDWSVKLWELLLDAEIRARLAGQTGGMFEFFLRVHAYCVAQSVFVLPDGRMFAQTIAGGQLSGDYNTSSSNSRMRVIASLGARISLKWRQCEHEDTIHNCKVHCKTETTLTLCGRINIEAMGDDSYERAVRDLKQGLERIGHKVKFVETINRLEDLEFCSHKFLANGLAYPVNPDKTVYRFCSHKPSSINYLELSAQLMYVVRHLFGRDADVIKNLAAARVARATNLSEEKLEFVDYGKEEQSSSSSGSKA